MLKALKWIILGLLGLLIVIFFFMGTYIYLDYRQSRTAPNSASDRPVGETLVRPALDGIFEAFEAHPLVGISDHHFDAQAEAFYAAIIRDPRFARKVGNVVVEFGAAGRQDVIDRYVAGEDVPYQELRTVWTDTVGWFPKPGSLGYVQFFAQVRETNKTLLPDERIRVWLGEPPVDWSKVGSGWNLKLKRAEGQRDSYPAGVIVHNILEKDKKALVIYGGFHFKKKWSFPLGSLRSKVEAKYPGAFYIVLVNNGLRPEPCAKYLEQALDLWPMLALAAPTPGRASDPELCDCTVIDEADLIDRGLVTIIPIKRIIGVKPTKVLGDAVLFLGPVNDIDDIQYSPMMPDFFLDADYRREVSRRVEIQHGRPLFTVRPDFSLERAVYEVELDAIGYAELLESMFEEYDLNHDGVVTSNEYSDPIGQK
jgi:hypothetical protein